MPVSPGPASRAAAASAHPPLWFPAPLPQGLRKPSAESFATVVQHLGLPPDRLLFVDDRRVGTPRRLPCRCRSGADALQQPGVLLHTAALLPATLLLDRNSPSAAFPSPSLLPALFLPP